VRCAVPVTAVPQTAYLDLSDDEQVEALRPAARAAAEAFGLEVARLDLAAHAYNTTFDVGTADGRRYALRLNTNSTSTPAEVLAQQAWQLDIARTTPVRVPVPLADPSGRWFVEVPSELFGRPLTCTAAGWLDGRDVEQPDEVQAHELGRAMALLHDQAAGWSLPRGGTMPVFDEPLFGDPDRLSTAAGLDAEGHEVVARARARSVAAFDRVHGAGPVHALHADLHGGNLKWHEGRLAVFDFDDCGFGTPALDLAISAFYLRGGDPRPEQAVRAGYAQVRPLPDVDPADLEALVAARQLLLSNDLLGTTTAEMRAEADRYLVTTVDRLRHWLDTGAFTRVVPE
jgi:Ser/Thr protein kinase RdoA (MazF antagonist)